MHARFGSRQNGRICIKSWYLTRTNSYYEILFCIILPSQMHPDFPSRSATFIYAFFNAHSLTQRAIILQGFLSFQNWTTFVSRGDIDQKQDIVFYHISKVNPEKKVENTTRSRVFLTVFGAFELTTGFWKKAVTIFNLCWLRSDIQKISWLWLPLIR